MIGAQMTADQYILTHWKPHRIYENNSRPHHNRRFDFVARNLVGERFLDCGCALGHSTARLAEMKPGEWQGVDFCEAAVAEARQNFPAIPFAYLKDFASLPTLGRFDSIVCSEVLEHVREDRQLVEALMSMTPRLIITTPCRNVGDPGHMRLYTAATLARLFAGYQLTLVVDKPFFFGVVTHA